VTSGLFLALATLQLRALHAEAPASAYFCSLVAEFLEEAGYWLHTATLQGGD
jgi:hypothetical protein